MGTVRQLDRTSLGSNSAPPLLSDLSKSLPRTGPGSLGGEGVRPESFLPSPGNPGPHSQVLWGRGDH